MRKDRCSENLLGQRSFCMDSKEFVRFLPVRSIIGVGGDSVTEFEKLYDTYLTMCIGTSGGFPGRLRCTGLIMSDRQELLRYPYQKVERFQAADMGCLHHLYHRVRKMIIGGIYDIREAGMIDRVRQADEAAKAYYEEMDSLKDAPVLQ